MNKNFRFSILVLLLAFALILGGCQPANPVEGDSADQIRAVADPIAETIVKGLVDNSQDTFSTGFDSKLASAFRSADFDSLRQSFIDRVGSYQSLKYDSILEQNGYYNVIYIITGDKSSDLKMRLVFPSAEATELSGLWFDNLDG